MKESRKTNRKDLVGVELRFQRYCDDHDKTRWEERERARERERECVCGRESIPSMLSQCRCSPCCTRT